MKYLFFPLLFSSQHTDTTTKQKAWLITVKGSNYCQPGCIIASGDRQILLWTLAERSCAVVYSRQAGTEYRSRQDIFFLLAPDLIMQSFSSASQPATLHFYQVTEDTRLQSRLVHEISLSLSIQRGFIYLSPSLYVEFLSLYLSISLSSLPLYLSPTVLTFFFLFPLSLASLSLSFIHFFDFLSHIHA